MEAAGGAFKKGVTAGVNASGRRGSTANGRGARRARLARATSGSSVVALAIVEGEATGGNPATETQLETPRASGGATARAVDKGGALVISQLKVLRLPRVLAGPIALKGGRAPTRFVMVERKRSSIGAGTRLLAGGGACINGAGGVRGGAGSGVRRPGTSSLRVRSVARERALHARGVSVGARLGVVARAHQKSAKVKA